jgi:hypothetical protein
MYQTILLSSLLKPSGLDSFRGADELVELIESNSYQLVTNYIGNWCVFNLIDIIFEFKVF